MRIDVETRRVEMVELRGVELEKSSMRGRRYHVKTACRRVLSIRIA